ncbi:MAG: PD40 domain-containing protein [Armatimonadetes bacterium]|nr:PD40 domain-containing protein [Armatimonadota bacterium]
MKRWGWLAFVGSITAGLIVQAIWKDAYLQTPSHVREKVRVATGKAEMGEYEIRDPRYDLSPDGRTVAFTDAKGLWLIALESGQQQLLRSGWYHTLQWSPTGEKLALVESDRSLVIMDVKTPSARLHRQSVLSRYALRASYSPCALSWSPDGKRVAWIREGKLVISDIERVGELVVSSVEPGGTDQEAEALGGFTPYEVQWSPDGQYIAFTGTTLPAPTGNKRRPYTWREPKVGVVKPDGSGLRFILSRSNLSGIKSVPMEAFPYSLRWSPDGNRLAVFFNFKVWTVSREGSSPRAVWTPQARITELCWSPDGTGLLCMIGRAHGIAPPPPVYPLYWLSADGKAHRILMEEKEPIREVRWRRQDEILYFSGNTLWLVKLK